MVKLQEWKLEYYLVLECRNIRPIKGGVKREEMASATEREPLGKMFWGEKMWVRVSPQEIHAMNAVGLG